MLSRLLGTRLRAADKALRADRLDEAFRLATSPDLKSNRKAKAILDKLTQPLIDRAREHYREERFREALLDLDKANLAGASEDATKELRWQIEAVAREVERNQDSRRGRLNDARKRIEQGSLVAGQRILDQASRNDLAAEQLQREAGRRSAEVSDMVKQIEQLIASEKWTAACERLVRASAVDAHHKDVSRLETKLCKLVLKQVQQSLQQGLLGRAEHELTCMGKLGHDLPDKRAYLEVLSTAKKASAALERHDYGETKRLALTLDRLLPKTSWVKDAIKVVEQIEQSTTALLAGPLGHTKAIETVATPARHAPVMARPTSLDETIALPDRAGDIGGLPNRMLLLVDGGGSFLLLRSDQASIGRTDGNHWADIPLMSDISERRATISRMDEDYFVLSGDPIEVAGRRTNHQLLRDGDRIVLGRKSKMTFRLPSRKSPTAALDLSDTTKMPNDVRRVLLFNLHATLGQGPAAHIPCRHAGTPLILFERAGSLWIRAKNNGHVDTQAQELRMGESIEICGVGLVLTPWIVRKSGGVHKSGGMV